MNNWNTDIEHCLATLRKGGIILYPTDTVWGFGCDASNAEAVAKIYKLKKRDDKKSLILLVASEVEIMHYVEAPDPEIFQYLESVQRPTTVVYQNAKNLAPNLIPEDRSIAIRICKDEFCKDLIRQFGKAIVSTSANISGLSTPSNFAAIPQQLKDAVDYLVQYRQDDLKPGIPSTLIQWKEGQRQILRP